MSTRLQKKENILELYIYILKAESLLEVVALSSLNKPRDRYTFSSIVLCVLSSVRHGILFLLRWTSLADPNENLDTSIEEKDVVVL